MNVPRQGTAAVRVRSLLHNACHAVRVDRRARCFHAYRYCQHSVPFGASDYRLRACVNVRPRYSRNTFAVFQVPRTSQLVSRTEVQASYTSRRSCRVAKFRSPPSHRAVNSSYENRAAADARSRRIDPVRRMTMAGHRAPAVAGRPGERALAKPPRRTCNPIRGDRNSAYGDSAVALPPRDDQSGATRPRRRRRSGDRCRPAARRWSRAGSHPRGRRFRRSPRARRRRGRACAGRR